MGRTEGGRKWVEKRPISSVLCKLDGEPSLSLWRFGTEGVTGHLYIDSSNPLWVSGPPTGGPEWRGSGEKKDPRHGARILHGAKDMERKATSVWWPWSPHSGAAKGASSRNAKQVPPVVRSPLTSLLQLRVMRSQSSNPSIQDISKTQVSLLLVHST